MAKGKKYGKLYNWYAVSDIRNVAPEGWHVSDSIDWHILIEYLGGKGLAGAKLKDVGVTWKNPNFLATNESGFTALPGAFRFYGGGFFDVNYNYVIDNGYWWTSTPIVQLPTGWAFNYSMGYSTGQIYQGSSAKRSGFSIRCVKD